MNFEFGNAINKRNNCKNNKISYPNAFSNNNPINNNYNHMPNNMNNQNDLQKTMKEIEELNKKNAIINN